MTIPAYRLSALDEYRFASSFALHAPNGYDNTSGGPGTPTPREDLYGYLTATGGSISYVPTESAWRLNVSSSSGSTAQLETNEHFRFQAGRGMRFMYAVYGSAAQVNQRRRWGPFSDTDGMFFELEDSTLYAVMRTNGVDTRVASIAWNGDRFDGANALEAFDPTHPYVFEYQAPPSGIGTFRFFVNGTLVHAASTLDETLIPSRLSIQRWPLRALIENTGASAGASFTVLGERVEVEGGAPDPGLIFSAAVETSSAAAPGALLLAVRPISISNTNRVVLLPRYVDLAADASDVTFEIWHAPTLTGGSASAVTNSFAETIAGATFTGGILVGSIDVLDGASKRVDLTMFYQSRKLLLRNYVAGAATHARDAIAIIAKSATPRTCRALVAWGENR